MDKEALEKIAKELYLETRRMFPEKADWGFDSWATIPQTGKKAWIEYAENILKSLKELNYCQIEPDAELHEELLILEGITECSEIVRARRAGYSQAQQDMLKAGWRKAKGLGK